MTSALEIVPFADGVGLRLLGELDIATAPELVTALGSVASDGEVQLDLAELTFIDSAGIHVILAFARSRNGRGPVVLLDPPHLIARAIEITSIDKHPLIEVRRTG